jgi:broad specificity phosphatase PhoE
MFPGMVRAFLRATRPIDVYIVRHGQSAGNAKGVFQGKTDYPLTDLGRKQAERSANFFTGKDICSIFASPLLRAAETAEIIADAFGGPRPRLEESLSELDTGRFSDLTWEEASLKYPEEFVRFEASSWKAVKSAESPRAMFDRALRAWDILIEGAEAKGGAVLAVSHGGLIHWLFKTTMGCREWLPILPMNNCGIFMLSIMPVIGSRIPFLEWRLLNYDYAETEKDNKTERKK